MTSWALTREDPGIRPTVATTVRWWRSLRWRTALATAGLAALLVTGAGAALAESTLQGAQAQLRAQAVAQLRTAIATAAFGGAPAPGVTNDAAALPSALRAEVARQDAIVTFDDGQVMWAARRSSGGGVLATRVGNASVERQRDAVVTTLLVVGLITVPVAAVGSWLIAGRLTARLRSTAASVNRVIAGDRVAAAAQRDEVDVMREALTATAAALGHRLERERAFTADVAHDLRTPLTALASAAQLLEPSPAADRVHRQVVRMTRLVDDLLELARADPMQRGAVGTVSVREIAAEAIAVQAQPERIRLDVVADATVTLETSRLAGVLRNLVGNAVRHGGGAVTVTVDGRRIVVRDDGSGFPERLLSTGPRRFAADGDRAGTGLGLAICAEHCLALGADLLLRNPDGGGAEATVTLPSAG